MITYHQTQNKEAIYWHESSLLTVPHAMLCRSGGVSQEQFASLNLSYTVGDKKESVRKNRARVKQLFPLNHLVSCVQVHGDRIVAVENIEKDTVFPDADALMTNQPGIGLLIQQADCQAILFHDPIQKAIGAAHSGWKGSVLDIAGQTVSAMRKKYGSNPADIRAVISPSLGPCCAEFLNASWELPDSFFTHQVAENYFDFWAISRKQLLKAGLERDNIEITGLCTACGDNFFSYRRAKKQGSDHTGRNGSILCLPSRKKTT